MTFQNIISALKNPGLHLSKEIILSQIDEKMIWNVSLGFEPNEGDIITSPYRKDNNPGCKFIRDDQSGLLCLYDGAAIGSKVNGISIFKVDCFQSIQILKNYTEGLVLSKIQEIINQGRLEGIELGSTVIKKSVKTNKKNKTLIYYWERKWNKWDKEYWSPYGITKDQLVSDGIIPINSWGLKSENSSEWKKFWCTHWCSYIINDDSWGDKVKGYQPFSKSLRFFGNVDNNCIGNLWDLNKNDKHIFIKKSYKDWRVMTNLGYKAIWFQNEGMLPNLELLEDYKNAKFTILFDNDNAGIKSAYKIRNKMLDNGFKVRAIILNRKFIKYKVKDPSDLVKKFPKLKNKFKNELFAKTRNELLETIPKKIHKL